MKPLYCVLNIRDRDEFEKEFQIPYGYGTSIIFEDFESAVKYVDEHQQTYSIVKVDLEGKETVYHGRGAV